MVDLLTGSLPAVWEGRDIDPDFRPMVWLLNQMLRCKTEEQQAQLAQEALRRFFRESIPPQEAPQAFDSLLRFCFDGIRQSAYESSDEGGSVGSIDLDYQCDAPYVLGAFQQVYGIDLTSERVHWWRFQALIRALPEETPLRRIIDIRQADTSEMDAAHREWYEKMKDRFALPAELKGVKRHETLQEHEDAFLARFG